ncbi:MAG: carboxypeptidase regulatory-like domain-containing protein [Planctomycetes bacterium]|nr:carboxypeptidase regulatory-like domain-containing protein [Planctomycetota bacterium]
MTPRRKKTLCWLAGFAALAFGGAWLAREWLEAPSLATVARPERNGDSAAAVDANGAAGASGSANDESAIADAAARGFAARPKRVALADHVCDPARVATGGAVREFDVRFADGRAASGATVIAFDAQRELARDVTDAEGRARLAIDAPSVGILVAGERLVASYRELALGAAPTLVELPSGVLAGRLRPLDAALDRSVGLRIASDRPWFDVDELPPGANTALPAEWLAPTERNVQADAGGRFRLEGLSETWSGSLCVGPECTLLAVSPPGKLGALDEARVSAPIAELVLDVFQRPRLVGRIVARSGGEGVAGLDVRLTPYYSVTRGSSSIAAPQRFLTTRTAEDGSFAVWLPEQERVEGNVRPSWPELDRAELFASEPSSGASRNFVRPASAMRGSFDLGEFVFATDASAIEFRVRDPRGGAIVGAQLGCGGAGARTDAQGRARLALGEDRVVAIEALGYRPTRVEVSGRASTEAASDSHAATSSSPSEPAPFDVELEPTTLLTLRMLRAGGRPAPGVRLACDDLGVFESQASSSDAQALGASALTAISSGFVVETDARGEVLLCGLRPSVPIGFTVQGAFGEALQRIPIVLAPGEHAARSVALAFEPDFTTLVIRGVVTDVEQRPLVGVAVGAGRHGAWRGAVTDALGRFAIEHATPGEVEFRLHKPGFAPLTSVTRRVESESTQLHFTLSTTRTVRLRAEDAGGRGIALDALRIVWADGAEQRHERLPASGFETAFAPTETARVEARIAGATYVRTLGAQDAELVFAVPDHGRATFGLPPSDAPIGAERVELDNARFVVVRDVEGNLAPQKAYFAYGASSATIERLLPGDYEACFACSDAAEGPARESVRFRVRANETAEVALAP